jgi:murein L,D-transpeptidase YafK
MTRSLPLLALLLVADGARAQDELADSILVDKSERTLTVKSNGKVLATYPVVFGINPVGHKQRQGDRRTPEGKYVLDYQNPGSAYYRSIHISYPNAADRAAARRAGVSPGGDIMIHGQPNDPRIRANIERWPNSDWTDGCIALSNADMRKLWNQVRVPVPIEITP